MNAPRGLPKGKTTSLGKDLVTAVEAVLDEWRAAGNVRRLWARDATLWTGADEARWLDWLTIVDAELVHVEELERFRDEVRERRFRDVLLIGMGGSSLGPEVLAQTLGATAGSPRLLVLDSTDPEQVRATEAAVDLGRTLFIVASKSGSTLEPNVLKDYFFDEAGKALGRDRVGGHFVAITDPGSSMEKTARADGFWRIFYGLPQIGGRYSVLSRFGLAPAAAVGVDVRRLLETAREMVRACGPDAPPADNPGVKLGVALAVAAKRGHDKLTLVASPGVAAVGAWAEQLIAESLGKEGKAVIPVDDEPLGPPSLYGDDRLFIQLRLPDAADAEQNAALDSLDKAGHPVLRIALASPYHLGQEFFRFEFATAVAGAVLGVHPFDQPDVEASKLKTRELTNAYGASGSLPAESPVFEDDAVALFTDAANAEALRASGAGANLESWLTAHLARIRAGDYVALLAYVARNARHAATLQEARMAIRDDRRVATCLGFGPRFLHSTGQAYKGGPDSGVFLQITHGAANDLPIPGRGYTFGTVEAAQARGDFDVLAERGRRLLRVHLKGDVSEGLKRLAGAIRRALV